MFIVHRLTTYAQQKIVRTMGVIFGADQNEGGKRPLNLASRSLMAHERMIV